MFTVSSRSARLCCSADLVMGFAQASKARAAADKFQRRQIDHPNFHNVTQGDALAHLSQVGDSIFRPSPKGTDRLCLSIAVGAHTCNSCPLKRRVWPLWYRGQPYKFFSLVGIADHYPFSM